MPRLAGGDANYPRGVPMKPARHTKLFYLLCIFLGGALLGSCAEMMPTPTPTTAPTPTSTPENYVPPNVTQQVDAYLIEIWNDRVPTHLVPHMLYGYGQITSPNTEPFAISDAREFASLPATDISGEGEPDILIATYAGGSRVQHGYKLINLGTNPTTLLTFSGQRDHLVTADFPQYWFGAAEPFVDLNGDGIYEIIIRESIDIPCSQPSVPVLLGFESGAYVAVNAQYPEWYEAEFARMRAWARETTARLALDQPDPCSIYPLVIAYHYAGLQAAAWEIMTENGLSATEGEHRAIIDQALRDSSLFLNQ